MNDTVTGSPSVKAHFAKIYTTRTTTRSCRTRNVHSISIRQVASDAATLRCCTPPAAAAAEWQFTASVV